MMTRFFYCSIGMEEEFSIENELKPVFNANNYLAENWSAIKQIAILHTIQFIFRSRVTRQTSASF